MYELLFGIMKLSQYMMCVYKGHSCYILYICFTLVVVQGDSGGPMVCTQLGNKVLAGVTSWGVSGCGTSYPSVYARVSNYRLWLDTEMNVTY